MLTAMTLDTYENLVLAYDDSAQEVVILVSPIDYFKIKVCVLRIGRLRYRFVFHSTFLSIVSPFS